MTTETDETLMRRLGAGDTNALDRLFRRHHATAHAVCVRICGSAATADDLVQDAFIRVIRHARTFRAESSFRTWLLTIVRNVCLDHARSEARRTRLHVHAAADGGDIGTPTSVIDVDTLNRALAELPHDLREALVLHRLNDLSHRETAAILGCTEGAARVRVHRALQRLRDILVAQEQSQ